MKPVLSVAVDAAAILAVGVLCALGKMSAELAGGLILAVCSGRLYPRPLSGHGSDGGPSSLPPSGLATVALALFSAGGILAAGPKRA